MKLNERDVALLLSEEGRAVMELSHVNLAEGGSFWVRVEEANDLGLWVRAQREDGDHILLIRWEYVLSVDFPAGGVKRAGIRSE
jgi:hypothetical protein